MAEEIEITGKQVSSNGGIFRALSHRNYRLFWSGAFLSNVGTWMQAVAQGWLVLKLTNSPFLLGLDGFMATAPGLVFTLAGGVFADLVDRKRLLIYTQVGAGLAAFVLAALIATGIVQWWMILILSFVTGSCMSLAGPSYQAITIDLVGREDLANAIALNSTQFQLSRVIGPTMAGLAIKAFGLTGCFFANGLSYIAIVAALARVTLPRNAGDALPRVSKNRSKLWHDLMEGFRYVRSRPRVFKLLSITAVTSLFGAPYFTLVPIFARDIFGLGETGLALMMGTNGAGAFCGALVLTFLGDFRRKGVAVLGGAFAFSIFLIFFSSSGSFRLSLIFLFGMGFSIVFAVAVINMLLQEIVTDEMRGRVMSMFILSFIGAMPFGNILAGASSNRYGAPRTLAGGGGIIALYVIVTSIRGSRLRKLD